ncbi:MAG TPA: P-loop NTPase fold protein, partial [Pyrinomonadaceae bacterium]
TDVSASPQALLREAYRFAVQQPEVREQVKIAENKLDKEVEKAAQKLNISSDRAATATVKEQLLELQGLWGYARAIVLAMRNTKNIWRWLLSIAFFLAVVVGLVWLLPRALGYDSINAALVRFIGALLAIVAAVTPFIPGVRSALRIIDGAIKSNQELIEQTRRDKEKELQQQHQELQQRATAAQQNVEKIKDEAEELKKQLDDLRSDRKMSNFIRQRQQSTDYTKYQGVIAKARSDFEQLSTLLAKEKERRYTKQEEARREKEQERAQGQTGKAGEGAQGQEAQAKENELLLPSIDRIILYIDDLDRCPENKVVEVLQAVHLLLAFPLFIVVVGVDPRWLLHSLRQHSNVFRDKTEDTDHSEEERTHWQSTPLNYLEKIFQIPFTLWPMESSGFAKMIDNLTAQPSKPERKKADPGKSPGAGTPAPEKPEAGSSAADAGDTSAPPVVGRTPAEDIGAADTNKPAQGTNTPVNTQPTPEHTQAAVEQNAGKPPAKSIDLHPEHLQIKPWEREFMKKLHKLIPSPRATKRFINVYRLIRASVDIDDEVVLKEFVGDEKQGEYRAVLLLLAILVGYPDQATEILRDLLEKKHTETWWEFINSFKERAEKREATPDRNDGVVDEDGPAPKGRSATKRSAARAQVVKRRAAKASDGKNNGAMTENGATANALSEADVERWEQLLEKLKILRPLIDDQSC